MISYPSIENPFKREAGGSNLLQPYVWTRPEFEYLKDNEWTFTEKVDGTNVRVIWEREVDFEEHEVRTSIEYRGRTDRATLHPELLSHLADKFNSESAHEYLHDQFPSGATLYGEGYGAGIQKGGCYGPDKRFILFDILVGEWWLSEGAARGIASALGIPHVPTIARGGLAVGIEMVRHGLDSVMGSGYAEGLVAKPVVPLAMRNRDRLITKIKHRDLYNRQALR